MILFKINQISVIVIMEIAANIGLNEKFFVPNIVKYLHMRSEQYRVP